MTAPRENLWTDIAAVLTVYENVTPPENRGPWYDRLRQDVDRAAARSPYCPTSVTGHPSGCRCRGPATEISTRRKARSGTVHEMADYGVGTMCGRDLPEPWEYTDDPVSCKQCLSAMSDSGQQITTPEADDNGSSEGGR